MQNIELNNAISDYFDRVVAVSGRQGLLAAIPYLATHNLLGSDAFIGTVKHDGKIPEDFLKRLIMIVHSTLTVDFPADAITKAGEEEVEMCATFSKVFWIHAVSAYLEVPNSMTETLIAGMRHDEKIVTKRKAMYRSMDKGFFRIPESEHKNYTLTEWLKGTYVDIHTAIEES